MIPRHYPPRKQDQVALYLGVGAGAQASVGFFPEHRGGYLYHTDWLTFLTVK